MAKSVQAYPCQPSEVFDIYIHDTDKFFKRLFFCCLVFAFFREVRRFGVGAALVLDLLARHTEEQTYYQIEDIDKETKFI